MEPTIDNETAEALDWIKRQGCFELCGSRYWGTEHEDSDWDYFTEYTDLMQEMVVNDGWEPIEGDYVDANTITVLQKGNVQAIFVHSAERRKQARQIMKDDGMPFNNTEAWDYVYKHLN